MTEREIMVGAIALAFDVARHYQLGLTPLTWAQHNYEAYLAQSKLVLEAVEKERAEVKAFLNAE